MSILNMVSGFVVMAVALTELENLSPFKKGTSLIARWLAAAWSFVALGAGGSIASPFLEHHHHSAALTFMTTGFAIFCGLKVYDQYFAAK